MAILGFQLSQVGNAGVVPRFIFINTDNTIAEVTTAGYLNSFVAQGNNISETDMAVVITRATPNARAAQVNLMDISFSNGDWSLGTNSTPSTLLNGLIFVGNASNVATGVSMSGDATIANNGVVTIANNAITNAKVSTSAAIAYTKLASMPVGSILAGASGSVPTATAMSGDATISGTGAVTIANSAVTLAKLATGVSPAGVIKFMAKYRTTGGNPAVISIPGVLATDLAFIQALNDPSNPILGAVTANNQLTITFTTDPGSDTDLYYIIVRAAS
jgi:hypothetical protein